MLIGFFLCLKETTLDIACWHQQIQISHLYIRDLKFLAAMVHGRPYFEL
jgi:hypothetical protein